MVRTQHRPLLDYLEMTLFERDQSGRGALPGPIAAT
jgi:hypothetical protein